MPHSEAWHEGRRLGIGGSDIAAIAGLSNPRYSSPMTVYLDKLKASADDGDSPSEAAEWGTRLEETVAKKFADEHPEFQVYKSFTDDGEEERFVHPEFPWAFAHPDRLLATLGEHGLESALSDVTVAEVLLKSTTALWECKTVGREARKHAWQDDLGNDKVPDGVNAQVQWYLGVLNLPVAWLSVLFEGRYYKEWRIERDQEFIDVLLGIGAEFWKLVESKTPPPIDASAATSEVLAILYREVVDDVIDLGAEGTSLAQGRVWAKQKVDDAEGALLGIDNQLKALLGAHEQGAAGPFLVSWREQTRKGSLDAKAIEADYPEIADQYRRPPSVFRTLRVAELRED